MIDVGFRRKKTKSATIISMLRELVNVPAKARLPLCYLVNACRSMYLCNIRVVAVKYPSIYFPLV